MVFEKLTLPLRSRAHLRDYGSHEHPMLGARGFDGHKRVKGRKRHLLLDTLGMVVARRVEANRP
jgi:hypothetical protein